MLIQSHHSVQHKRFSLSIFFSFQGSNNHQLSLVFFVIHTGSMTFKITSHCFHGKLNGQNNECLIRVLFGISLEESF